ncbi:MAG: serine/threonine-protein phosphatase [Bacteroidales bacterium]|nr:serine/threonine-protein phosphatase [Bacteroidales bacterium]
MAITIIKPNGLSEKGKRENNEDAIYPATSAATANDRLFMVCDGIGGAEKGEIASDLTIKTIAGYFQANQRKAIDESFIQNAVRHTQVQFDQYLVKNPHAKGMGTTLTLCCFSGNKAIIAHIGDSRVYHIRNGEIRFQTEDHSLVNSLVKNNIITPEEALTHPKRNVITRAIQGDSVSKAIPDITILDDLQPGDYFFLCSDGISEAISNATLCEILGSNLSNEGKTEEISNRCKEHSRDNYSAYLIQIDQVSGQTTEKRDLIAIFRNAKEFIQAQKFWVKISLALISLLIILLMIIIFTPAHEKEVKPRQKNSSSKEGNKEVIQYDSTGNSQTNPNITPANAPAAGTVSKSVNDQ